MTVETSGSTLKINGNIKSIGDFQTIKSSLDSMITEHKSLTLSIENSISMTSSMIGYLIKLIHKEQIKINISLGDERLYSLLEDLDLVRSFNVRKVSK